MRCNLRASHSEVLRNLVARRSWGWGRAQGWGHSSTGLIAGYVGDGRAMTLVVQKNQGDRS
ncbi:hypothetical protein D8674_036832 [Pyrus ussuriensis x Pyrus communis]|uniref:Uncharacterized protein n=1 Tax=Pyrus ussuriensis x Pyrus communis TaxID=2448454 RepID=A0A5N5GF94_9ROSA|nr:hypothetical protein D8674_036832 [Pyrus ussuriensis x Pyrus communis]